MMKENIHHFRIFLVLFLLFSFCSFSSAQSLLLSEDFNDCDLAADWTVNIIGNQDAVWYVGMPQNSNSDGSTIDGSCMLIIDDDATGNDTNPFTFQMTSPTFNGLGFEKLELSIDVHFRFLDESYLRIDVFDGNEYHTIANYQGFNGTTGQQFSEFETVTADLSFYASDNMSIRIEYDDGNTWAWWAGVDNISVVGVGDGDIVFSETFNDCAQPTDWTSEILNGDDGWQFGLIDNGNANPNSMNGSCFAYFDDDGIGQDAAFSTVRLISPVFNGIDYANFKVDFDLILRRYADLEHFAIYVYDGTDYHQVESYFYDVGGVQFDNYVTISLDLSAYRSNQMQVVFHYEDGNAWGWWVGIDNVKVIGSGVASDICENAIEIVPGEACLAGDNSTAIFTGPAITCFDNNVGSLWYHFQSPIDGIIRINSAAQFNDLISVFEGSCSNLDLLDCNNRDEHGFTGETHYMTVSNGTDYYIRINGIDSRFGLSRGAFCLSLEEVPAFPLPPTNDICANSIVLSVDATACITGSNYNADFTGPEPTLNLKSRSDIWYQFTATATELTINTGADFADVITVYSGNCDNLTEVAVNEFGQSLTLNDLAIGETYPIQISGFFATIEGNVCMEVVTPEEGTAENDLCQNATFIAVDGNCVEGENIFAEFEGPTPSCEIFPTSDIWFEFTAPASGGVQINTGSSFPHVVAIYSGTCGNLEELQCIQNPTFCGGYFDVQDLIPGENYFIQIASTENDFGYLFGDLCISILDIQSTETFDPLELLINVNCIGEGTAVLEVVPLGGVGVYLLTGSASNDTLQTGDVFFTILSDDLGCEVSVTGIVDCGEIPCEVGTELITSNVSCYNENNGQATIDESGAENGPLSYQWSQGSTTANVSNLSPGNYTVTITDAAECSEVYEFIITQPDPLIVNATATGETGSGTNDGTASANPSGGIAPYTYAWNNGVTNPDINNLPPGIYTVTITDTNGCTNEAAVTVNSFDCAISVSIDSDNISCFGNTDGFAAADIVNGTPPFTYLWSTGATTASISDLAVGSYSVTVEDANDCPSTATIFIDQPMEAIGSVVSLTDALCYNEANGTAEVMVSGGTVPYTYNWPGGASGPLQEDLLAGDYTVSFEDANGCTGEIELSIGEPDALTSEIADSQNVTCFGNDDGSATAFANGGTPGYTYLWSDALAQTSATATNLGPGAYTVTITDANGCTQTASTTIISPDQINISIDNIVDEVGDQSNGSITITVAGGVAPYTYNWTLGGNFFSSDQDIFNLAAGTYTLLITDANDCVILVENIIVNTIVSVDAPQLETAIQLLPNPTNGKFWVQINLSERQHVQVVVFDVLGRQLFTTEREKVAEAIYPFDMTGIAAGVFAVRVYLDEGVVVRPGVLIGE